MTTWTDTLKPKLQGTNIVTNGTFDGSASGWTLGTGWTYGTNNAQWSPLGSELVTNGSFTGSATGWTLGTGWSYASDHVSTNGSQGGGHNLNQSVTFTGGVTYRISFTASSGNSGGLTYGINTVSTTNIPTTNGTHSQDILVSSTAANLVILNPVIGSNPSSYAGDIDDVSAKQVNQGVLSQTTSAISGYTYQFSATAGGTTGYITVSLGSNSFTVPAGQTVTQNLIATSNILQISASSDFDGTVDSISALLIGAVWTDIAKPTAFTVSSTVTFIGGTPIGLLLALTQSSVTGITSVVTSKWTDVPTHAASWTNIPKAI